MIIHIKSRLPERPFDQNDTTFFLPCTSESWSREKPPRQVLFSKYKPVAKIVELLKLNKAKKTPANGVGGGGLFIFLHAVSLHLTRQMKARIAVTTLPLFITPPSLLAQLRLLTLASSHPQRCKFTSSHFQVKARDRYLSHLSRWNNGNEKRTHHKRIGLDRWQP